MVAVLCAWHEHHSRAVQALDQLLDEGGTLVAAAPALIETYAVLTRLPPPHRLSPASSEALISANFLHDAVETVALGAIEYDRLLRDAPARAVAGGAIYDAVVLACALAAGVSAVLTFNQSHFDRLATGDIDIVVP